MGISHWMVRGVAVAALAVASITGHAEVFSDVCNGCTPQQEADTAKQALPAGTPPNVEHDVYIVDYNAETLSRFRVWNVAEYWDNLFYTVAVPAPVPAHIQQQFAIDIAELKSFVQASEEITRDIPASVAASAFAYEEDSGVRTRTHAWISGSLSFFERLAVYNAGFIKILKVNIQLVLKVRFSDGSTAHLEFLGEVDGVMWWRAVPGMTQDPEGNDITSPSGTLNAFQGTYQSQYNARRMHRYLSQWFGGLECTLIPNGNETILRCHQRQFPRPVY